MMETKPNPLVAKAKAAAIISCDKRLRHSTVRVATALLFYFHNTRTGACYPSQDQIAEWTGLHRSNVIRAIKELEQSGYLTVTRGRYSNSYCFNLNVATAQRRGGARYGVSATSDVVPAHKHSSANAPYPVSYPVNLSGERRTQRKGAAVVDEHESTQLSPWREARRAKRSRVLPQNWAPSDAGIDFAFKHGMTGDRLNDEVAHFGAHQRRTGRVSADWDAEWQVWALNDKRFRRKANGQRRGRRSAYADILLEEDAG